MTDPVMPGGWEGKGVRLGPERRWVEWLVGCRGWVALVWAHFCCERDDCHKKKNCNRPVLEPRTCSGHRYTRYLISLSEFLSLITPSTSEQSKTKPATTVLQVMRIKKFNQCDLVHQPVLRCCVGAALVLPTLLIAGVFGEGATTRADCDRCRRRQLGVYAHALFSARANLQTRGHRVV